MADGLHLGVDVDAGATIFDLDNTTPLHVQLFSMASLALNQAAVDERIHQEMVQLQNVIDQSLTHPGMGHLIEVAIFTDEFGYIAIPEGQIVYALGVGTEPLDAL